MSHAAEVAHDNRLLDLYIALAAAEGQAARRGARVIAEAASNADSGIVWKSATWQDRRSGYFVGDLPATPGGALHFAPEDVAQAFYDAQHVVFAAREDIRIHEQGYTGWSRFYLVTSSAGHVHSSLNCSTCKVTTTFAPVPSLSGSTEAEAVAVLGETLCTVCFPSAPVKPSKVTQAQATLLIEEGEDAFLAARAKYLAKQTPACPGSGTWDYDRATARLGFYSGNAATCNHCGERVTATASNKLRKH